MPYVDPQTVHNPATGAVAPAAWGDVVRDDLEFLIDPPACAVKHSTTQNVTSGASFTTLAADNEDFDNDAMHSTVTNNTRITAQTAGRYEFATTVIMQSNSAGGYRGIRFRRNGVNAVDLTHVFPANGAETILSGTRKVVLAVGDYIEVECRQNSGSTLTALLVEFSATLRTR